MRNLDQRTSVVYNIIIESTYACIYTHYYIVYKAAVTSCVGLSALSVKTGKLSHMDNQMHSDLLNPPFQCLNCVVKSNPAMKSK